MPLKFYSCAIERPKEVLNCIKKGLVSWVKKVFIKYIYISLRILVNSRLIPDYSLQHLLLAIPSYIIIKRNPLSNN
jgi:hypothetical protein